jgi:hypothetical protein
MTNKNRKLTITQVNKELINDPLMIEYIRDIGRVMKTKEEKENEKKDMVSYC